MKNKKYTFMVSILSLFAALAVILSVFLIYNFYNRGIENAYKILNEKNTEVVNNISKTIMGSMKSVERHLEVLSKVTTNKNITTDIDILERVTWEQLQSDEAIASIFLADENGSFIQSRRLPKLAFRHIDAKDNRKLDIWEYKDESNSIKTIHFKKLEYDPRIRPWYKEVTYNHKVNWSNPYIFSSTGTPGITISVGDFDQFNQKIKVAAADFSLDTLSKTLEEKSHLLGGDILMFNDSKDIVGTSKKLETKSKEQKLLKIDDLVDNRYSQAYEKLQKKELTGQIVNNNIEYIYFITTIPQVTGNNWYVLSFIEKKFIIADIKATMINTIIISLFIIVMIYFPIQYVLKKFVITPIRKLEYMTDEISKNRFQNLKPIKTIVYEFDELSHSMIDMASSIQKYEADQKKLMDSFIKLIATAIDGKSKYTGGHCERVPELSLMLIKEASSSEDGIFKEFKIENSDQLREVSVSAWLHDCGKVTTPEYVVDKATKLETIYNRIHEIRTRFDVIYRDLIIESLKKELNGENKEDIENWLKEEQNKLDEDFKFIATANVGDEFMKDEDKQRIIQIAQRTWTRHFDNTLGLSNEEALRMNDENSSTPAIENLLSDKKSHIIKRDDTTLKLNDKFGFKMDIPENLYNFGEVYNLSISRGTLTNEERYKIQEHVIMSIKMLEELPFPKELKNVPLFAGAHHETLIGTGYPRKLVKDEMPLASRAIAVADVFEALTASDRPYKSGKKLSEAIKILSFMVKDQHIDKDLFVLFLKSGIYKEYANKYLKPEQIDEVDVSKYL